MKIHQIAVQNLNSLYGEHRIDLDSDLDGASLFLVQGPTGSGKSTLMDAISLALFGTTPRMRDERSEQRIADEIMSDGTGDCWAELVFSKPGRQSRNREVFRARWTARRSYGRADGGIQPTERSLEQQSQDGAWMLLTSDKRAKVYGPHFEEVLEGFTVDDFQRSLLLAQGQFDKLLHADPSDRARILERLTNTEEYLEVGARAAAVHRGWRRRVEQLRPAAEAEGISEEALEALREAVAEARTAVEKTEATHAGLTRVRTWRTERRTLEAAVVSAGAELEQAERALAEVQGDATRLEQFEEAKGALRVLSEVEAAERSLEQSSGVLEKLQPQLTSTKAVRAEVEKRLGQVSERLKSARASKDQLGRLGRVFDAAQQAHAETVKRLEERRSELNGLTEELDAKKKTWAARQEDLGSAWNVVREAGASLPADLHEIIGKRLSTLLADMPERPAEEPTDTELLDAVTEARTTLETRRASLAELSKRRTALNGAEEELQQALSAKHTTAEELSTKRKALEQAQAQHRIAAEGLDAARAALRPIQRIRDLAEQRAELVPGEPCPLCGSTHHATDSLQDEAGEAYQAAKTRVEEAEAAVVRWRGETSKAEGALAVLTKKQEHADAAVRDAEAKKEQAANAWADAARRGEIEVGASSKVLEDRESLLGEARRAVEDVRDAAEALRETRRALAAAITNLEETEKRRAEVAGLATGLESESTEADGRQDEARSALLARWSAACEQEPRLKALEVDQQLREEPSRIEPAVAAFVESLERDETEARDELRRTDETLTGLATRETEARTRVSDAKDLLAEKIPALDSAMSALELDTREALRHRRLEEDEAKEIRDRRTSLDKAYAVAEAKLKDKRSQLAAKGEEKPELDDGASDEELASKLGELETALAALRREHTDREVALRRAENQQAQLETAKTALGEAMQESAVWQRLHDLIGVSDGERFRQFAQAMNLDQLLTRANVHLQRLNDRYRLRTVREEDSGLPTLEFVAVDLWRPDTARSLKTLSGGESFLTSLALALGLSDLRTSSMPIETLLLDEGFGTLDADTLDTALAALQQLQSTGRQVGIISHVAGLEDRIDARIEVEPLGNGRSRVKARVGPADAA